MGEIKNILKVSFGRKKEWGVKTFLSSHVEEDIKSALMGWGVYLGFGFHKIVEKYVLGNGYQNKKHAISILLRDKGK